MVNSVDILDGGSKPLLPTTLAEERSIVAHIPTMSLYLEGFRKFQNNSIAQRLDDLGIIIAVAS